MRKLRKYRVNLGIWCDSLEECKAICDFIEGNEYFVYDEVSIQKPIKNVITKWSVHIRTTTEVKKKIKRDLKVMKIVANKERYF